MSGHPGRPEAQLRRRDRRVVRSVRSARRARTYPIRRRTGVSDVCGAFFGPVLGEDLCAGLAEGFVAPCSRLSQQSFELGEDLLDRIEVGRVFWQEDEARPDIADRWSHGLSLVGAEIFGDHDVARFEGR